MHDSIPPWSRRGQADAWLILLAGLCNIEVERTVDALLWKLTSLSTADAAFRSEVDISFEVSTVNLLPESKLKRPVQGRLSLYSNGERARRSRCLAAIVAAMRDGVVAAMGPARPGRVEVISAT